MTRQLLLLLLIGLEPGLTEVFDKARQKLETWRNEGF
jgi:hypothetical protein